MKKLLLLMLVIGSAALSCFAADVQWLESAHNFGAIYEENGKVLCQFRFVNTCGEAVAIRSARASCGCTTPSFPKELIAVGDTAAITVAFNPSGRPGRFNKTVTIDLAGDTTTPARHTLTITGVVIGSTATLMSRYPVEAGNIKLRTSQLPFGSILKGRAKSAFLEVYNASTEPVTPRWENVPGYVRVATAENNNTIPPGEQMVYTFICTPDNNTPYGIITDSLTVSTDNNPPLTISISALLEEDFSTLTPGQRAKAPVIATEADRVDFGTFNRTDSPISRTFAISNRGKSELLVRRIYTLDGGVTLNNIPEKVKAGKTATFTLTVDPTLLPGDILNARIQIITNDPENPITIVRAVGLLN
jgi:hypothetical protein